MDKLFQNPNLPLETAPVSPLPADVDTIGGQQDTQTPLGATEMPQEELVLPTPGGNSEILDQPEAAPQLSREQLRVLGRYIEIVDQTPVTPGLLRSTVDAMSKTSQETGGDDQSGEVAVLGSTVGSMSRGGAQQERSAAELVRTLVKHEALSPKHATVFMEMQRRFASSRDASEIGLQLKHGLKFLDGRAEKHGEDVSKARIAFLTSALAATQDRGLRTAIFAELERVKPAQPEQ